MTTTQTLRFVSTTITSLIGDGINPTSTSFKSISGGSTTTTTTTTTASTGSNSDGGDDGNSDDPLTNPATSKIVRVTIACAIVVLGITGLITAFKIAGLYRSHRETRRRRIIQQTISTGGQIPAWMTQETKKKWGGRKVKNAHKQVEWEGVAA